MKAITLWQPWASAIALQIKSFETRPWATRYRGLRAIHAAKKSSRDLQAEFDYFVGERGFGAAFAKAGYQTFDDLPRGSVVAVCRVVDCLPTADLAGRGLLSAEEMAWGDYEGERFAWQLRDIVALAKPLPFPGQRGFFSVPDAPILARIA